MAAESPPMPAPMTATSMLYALIVLVLEVVLAVREGVKQDTCNCSLPRSQQKRGGEQVDISDSLRSMTADRSEAC